MLLSITLNPSVDHALFIEKLLLGDTNRVQRVERDAGGKGVNLSRVFAEMGGETTATGFLGGGAGKYVRHVLKAQGVVPDFVVTHDETRVNFSVESAEGGAPTTFNEKGPHVSAEEWERLLAKVDGLAKGAAWITLGGSLPPGVPVDAFRVLIDRVRTGGAKILLDADGDALRTGIEARPDFIKPNHHEAARLLGRPCDSDEEAIAAARELLGRVREAGFVVLSRGERGAVLAQGDRVWLGTSPKVVAKSTIGSGDSLLGAMLWAIVEGKPLDEAFRWGLAAGAATAETDGTGIARRSEVERLFSEALAAPV